MLLGDGGRGRERFTTKRDDATQSTLPACHLFVAAGLQGDEPMGRAHTCRWRSRTRCSRAAPPPPRSPSSPAPAGGRHSATSKGGVSGKKGTVLAVASRVQKKRAARVRLPPAYSCRRSRDSSVCATVSHERAHLAGRIHKPRSRRRRRRRRRRLGGGR